MNFGTILRSVSSRSWQNGSSIFLRSFHRIARNHEFNKRAFIRTATISGGGTVLAISLWQKVTEDPESALKKKIDDAIARADAFYNNQMMDALYEFLKTAATIDDHSEILWRLARATYEKSKKTLDTEERKRLTLEAFDQVKRALELDEKSFAAHKWYAILLEKKCAYDGTKAKIKESYQIKEHLQRAIDLNPRDATTWHILGVWYFTIANLKWYERQIASTFFASPPSATFQEALDCFLKAETLDPNFYCQNLLYLAKTYKELGDTNSAKKYLKAAIDYIVVTADDYAAHEEAEKLLKDIK